MSGIVSEMKKCPYLEDRGSKKIFISIFLEKKLISIILAQI